MSTSEKQIQWFPGHMTKTLRQMEKDIRNVDVVVEIMDARIPWSSQNPVLKRIGRSKKRIYILTKEDLADPAITEAWLTAFRKKEGYDAIAVNTKDAVKTKKRLYAFLDAYFEKNGKRILGKPRMMFVGVPNVGKSSVINILLGQNVLPEGSSGSVRSSMNCLTCLVYCGRNSMIRESGSIWHSLVR